MIYKQILNAVQTIFGVIYAISAEYVHIYTVLPATAIFALLMTIILMPLTYYVQRNTLFLKNTEGHIHDIRKKADKKIRKLKSQGYADDSDEVLTIEIMRDRKIRAAKKQHLVPGARVGYYICWIICLAATTPIFAALPDTLPRLSYILNNLVSVMERYGFTDQMHKAVGQSTAISGVNALYKATPSAWTAIAGISEDLAEIVQGVQKGMLNVCGLSGVSLGCTAADLWKSGIYAASVIPAVFTAAFVALPRIWKMRHDGLPVPDSITDIRTAKICLITGFAVECAVILAAMTNIPLLTVFYFIFLDLFRKVCTALCTRKAKRAVEKINEGQHVSKTIYAYK